MAFLDSSSWASVLVNGSPTSEFSIKRGLRQGDPLSLFLFILVVEGLHNALSTTGSSDLIRGVKFGSPEVLLDRFQSKLSSWKADLLYIGGRHTLIKAILGISSIYYFSSSMVPRIAFERNLEEIHVTWTQFEKKRDKIATLHEDNRDLAHSAWRRRHNPL
ncbi:hypothetical protein Tco_0573632 [Tanacetum coccineum]